MNFDQILVERDHREQTIRERLSHNDFDVLSQKSVDNVDSANSD